MRDPARIEKMLGTLRKVWERNPDLRLGQLIETAWHSADGDADLFYMEDDVLWTGLNELLRPVTGAK
jgi:uncharacterized protein YihD (DUF1040 family)